MYNLMKIILKTILDFVSKTRLKFILKPNLYNNKYVKKERKKYIKKEEYIVRKNQEAVENLIERVALSCPNCEKAVTTERQTEDYRLGRMHFYRCPVCKILLLALNDITPNMIASLQM